MSSISATSGSTVSGLFSSSTSGSASARLQAELEKAQAALEEAQKKSDQAAIQQQTALIQQLTRQIQQAQQSQKADSQAETTSSSASTTSSTTAGTPSAISAATPYSTMTKLDLSSIIDAIKAKLGEDDAGGTATAGETDAASETDSTGTDTLASNVQAFLKAAQSGDAGATAAAATSLAKDITHQLGGHPPPPPQGADATDADAADASGTAGTDAQDGLSQLAEDLTTFLKAARSGDADATDETAQALAHDFAQLVGGDRGTGDAEAAGASPDGTADGTAGTARDAGAKRVEDAYKLLQAIAQSLPGQDGAPAA